MTKITLNPVHSEELQLLNTADDFSGDFVQLDQTTPQTTVGTFTFPKIIMLDLLTLATGTTTIAPIKFVAGTNLTVPVTGVMEFDGTDLYITI